MVLERKCHCIEDPEIAELFELEASRGCGCGFRADFSTPKRDLFKDQEAECSNFSKSQGPTSQDS